MGQGAAVDADHTLQMSVADIGFMLDRLGRDCSPLQFLRELTQNSLDAIARTSTGSGTIIWDVDWAYLDLTGVYKLCIIDDGVGMTGQEMVRYINNLSASVHTQSHSGNFGVGAKIAAATRNHAGLVYLSWINNIGHTIHLWRSPVTNQYGLQRYTLPDGTFDHWGYLDDAVKPTEVISEHGTKVVLLGNYDEDDTVGAPKGAPSPSRWVVRFLNTRYLSLPRRRGGQGARGMGAPSVRWREELSQDGDRSSALSGAALIELRLGRDQWGHCPLVGLEGRAGVDPELRVHRLQRPYRRAQPRRAVRDVDVPGRRGSAPAVRGDLWTNPRGALRRTDREPRIGH